MRLFLPTDLSPPADVRNGKRRSRRVANVRDHGGLLLPCVSLRCSRIDYGPRVADYLCLADDSSSYYKKAGLAPAIHRVRMCELAVEHTSTWLMVDPWEAGQPEYTRTAVVLEHFNEMLNVQEGGLVMSDGKRRRYKIMLLAGGDLIESFGEPGVWSEPDVSWLRVFFDDEIEREYELIAVAYHSRPIWMPNRRASRFGRMGLPPFARYTVPPPVSLSIRQGTSVGIEHTS